MRGGGPGSWGVVISATIRTFPTLNFVLHRSLISLNSTSAVAALVELHANHIFDWDDFYASQYFTLEATHAPSISPMCPPNAPIPYDPICAMDSSMDPFLHEKDAQSFVWKSLTLFPVDSISAANESVEKFFHEVVAQGFDLVASSISLMNANDLLASPTPYDPSGKERLSGSRLVPEDVYRYNAKGVGDAFRNLLDAGAPL
jgi:hypothetical protein